MASVNGMESAMIRPGRTPRLMKLTTRIMAIACSRDVMNSEMAPSTVTAWSAMRFGSMPTGRVCGDPRHQLLDVCAESKNVTAIPHRDCKPDGRFAIYTKLRLRRVGIITPYFRDIAKAEHASAGDEIDVRDVLFRCKCA